MRRSPTHRASTLTVLLSVLSCAAPEPESSPDAGVVASRAMLPNEVIYKGSGTVPAYARALAIGDELGEIDISVPRYIGPYMPSFEHGRTLADYVALDTLGAFAKLSVRLTGASGVELGVLVRNLQTNGEWRPLEIYDPTIADAPRHQAVVSLAETERDHTAELTFPSEQLALAPARHTSAVNSFKLVVTRIDLPAEGTRAVTVTASLDFFAQAPIVLVHGINDTPANCWHDFVDEVSRAGFIGDTEVDFAGLSDKPGLDGDPPTYNGSVVDDVARIQLRLARILEDYGTSDVHLIGHSKGGLDLVNFLAGPYPAMKDAGIVRVLTLQTLASPHAGSVMADIVAPLKTWATTHHYDSVGEWPEWGVSIDGATDGNVYDTLTLSALKATVLTGSSGIEPGLSDLRTDSEAVKIDQAWHKDPEIRFAAYGWDADFERSRWLNFAGQLTNPPAEGDLLPKYATDCRGNPSGSDKWTYYCIDEDEVDTFFWGTTAYPPRGTTCSGWNTCGSLLWRTMANGRHATVTNTLQLGGSRSTIHVESYPAGGFVGNDLTVAVTSALHPQADANFSLAGEAPREIPGLQRFSEGGGTERYVARCGKTGANHISILRRSRTNMVECTAADTMAWMRNSVVIDEPPP